MKKAGNPFVFGAANDFSPDEVLEYYIEDFNYSRFLNCHAGRRRVSRGK